MIEGGVAQLVERSTVYRKVVGSNPITSALKNTIVLNT